MCSRGKAERALDTPPRDALRATVGEKSELRHGLGVRPRLATHKDDHAVLMV